MTPEEARLRKIQRKKHCTHIHVSGRRCSQVIDPKYKHCKQHRDGTVKVSPAGNIFAVCNECSFMLQTFTPPKGW